MNLKNLADSFSKYLGLTKPVEDSEEVKKLRVELKDMASHVFYSATNESLDAVVEGLDLKQDDSVLAVAGSGDQAFAMLEYAGKVTVVDNDSNQIALVRLRAEALRLGRYDLFLNLSPSAESKRRNKYFSKKGRLDRINANLENLTILGSSDVFALKGKSFSKTYLSNALICMRELFEIVEIVSAGGLIYFANGSIGGCKNIAGLKHVEELTSKARKNEKSRYNWLPEVYRKAKEASK